ncbi:hypothetical protein KW795_00435, partial [Candidatus Microgenomates bacterium]|nr:hypothetical protein [Candidatus Microgenomates bacterium]
MKHTKTYLWLSILFLIFLFLFNPHYISLGNVLEGWGVDQGLVLYKQIASFHLPLGRIPPLILYKIFNWDLRVTPWLGLFIGITNLIVIYKFGKKFLSQQATILSLIFFASTYWYFATGISFYHEQQVGLFLSLAILWFYNIFFSKDKSNIKSKFKDLFLLGTFLSITELSGQIASVTVFTLIVISIFYTVKTKKNWLKKLVYFCVGGIIPLILVALYFYIKNGLWDFIYWNFLYYQDYATLAGSFWDLPFLQVFVLLSPLVASLVLILIALLKKIKVTPQFLIMTIISASTIPFTLFSVFHYHHFTYAFFITVVLLGFLTDSKVKQQSIGRFIYFILIGFIGYSFL